MSKRTHKGEKPSWLEELKDISSTITATEAADMFNVSAPTIRRWSNKEGIRLMTQAERGVTMRRRKLTCALSPLFLNKPVTSKER